MTGDRAAMLAVGDELLDGRTIETNGALVARACGACGMVVVERRVVPDEVKTIAAAIGDLSTSCRWVIVSGGLGPTHDDVTREAVAEVMNEGLVLDPDLAESLGRRLGGRGDLDANLRQAMRPPSSAVLANAVGTAPGLVVTVGAATVVILPGPPHELEPMLLAWLTSLGLTGRRVVQRQVGAVGIPESSAGALVEALDRDRAIAVGITARDGVITATLTATEDEEEALEAAHRQIGVAWRPWTLAPDGQTVQEVVGAWLLERGESIAVAESCTGGLLAASLADVAGASRWFQGGWVTYANRMKVECLGVPESLLAADGPGAVSRDVAVAMASGAARRGDASWGVAVTGIAGPSGATPGKPVGTVFIGLHGRDTATVRHFCFPGDRSMVRRRSVVAAAAMVGFGLQGIDPGLMTWEVEP